MAWLLFPSRWRPFIGWLSHSTSPHLFSNNSEKLMKSQLNGVMNEEELKVKPIVWGWAMITQRFYVPCSVFVAALCVSVCQLALRRKSQRRTVCVNMCYSLHVCSSQQQMGTRFSYFYPKSTFCRLFHLLRRRCQFASVIACTCASRTPGTTLQIARSLISQRP